MFLVFLVSLYTLVYTQGVEPTDKQSNITRPKYEEILKKVRIKINKILRPGKERMTLAVIGVRGNRYDPKTKIYWKTELSQKAKEKLKEESEIVEKLIKEFDPTKEESVGAVEEHIKKNPEGYFVDELKELVKVDKD